MSHIKVAVRIRPLSQREINFHSTSVVEVQSNTNVIAVTNIKVPELNAGDSRERIRRFTFDFCFHPHSSQDDIFDAIGKEVENAIKKRYHSCILTYGQSSSGKTHTMMGNLNDPGLIPKFCKNIFKYLEEHHEEEKKELSSKVTMSYLEIYNEKVRDLLVSNNDVSRNSKNALRVREHPKNGPYVQGLTNRIAHDPETLLEWLKIGNSNRRVAATLTNPQSSRSHSVFTLTFSEGLQLHLVDLAGSEKAENRFQCISTFKEGANINKSLVALANVICTLADQSLKHLKQRFVPYRDSILTWLLKDTLGGNSKTLMIATVSPSSTCFNETVNTLRFGQRAKKIISHPVVIEDPKERIIRELRAEISRLKQLLFQQDPISFSSLNTKNTLELIEEKAKTTKAVITSDKLIFSSAFKRREELVLCANQERLLPMMDVTISEAQTKRKVPKIYRTSSVDVPKITPKPTTARSFGSQETILSSIREKPKRLSQPSVLRRKSIDTKPSPSFKNTLSRRSQENVVKKSETGVITEERGARKLEIKKQPQKPRSQIVAAVTSRLYGKTQKREVATETEEIKHESEEAPKELSICSNARLRLRELTRQALNAHRRRNVETQTDLFPVLRVKEISTDSYDLKVLLAEVKHAETETKNVETKDAGIACCINSFEDRDLKNVFVMTRTCGTQSTEDLLDQTEPGKKQAPEPSEPQQPPHTGISFTKYLRSKMVKPTFQIVNPCLDNPIYTSSVNINVSHNYINRTKQPELASDDSLEEDPQSVCFPTPDIISNHNSLEHGNASNNAFEQQQQQQQNVIEEKHAKSNTINESFIFGESFKTPQISNVCLARHSFIPQQCKELLNSIDIPFVFAPQVCVAKNKEERCGPFWKTLPSGNFLKPTITGQTILHIPIVQKPIVLKSIMKHGQDVSKRDQGDFSENRGCFGNISEFHGEDEKRFDNLPDSLTLTKGSLKKVRFPPTKHKRMMETVLKFMEEANNLLTNLSMAANSFKVERSYDLEVSINNISALTSNLRPLQCDFSVQACALEEASSQTSPRVSTDASSNTEGTFWLPVNKYENLVKQSCERLERCIDRVESKNYVANGLHTNTLSANSASNLRGATNSNKHWKLPGYGYSTTQTYKKSATSSPSEYLKQLTTIRRQIVESSCVNKMKIDM